jgi:preprotein translocase subunit SecG
VRANGPVKDGSMQSAILVLHLMIAVALIGLVLLQRSEGGALGIGGGGGGGGGFGGLMSSRGSASGLVRTTVYIAAAFFLTSIALSVIGNSPTGSVLDTIDVEQTGGGGARLPLPLGNERAQPATPAPATPAPSEPAVPLSQ